MITLAPSTRIFVYTEPTDMRKGFCGLQGIVKEHFQVDLFDGHLFVFFNRRRDYGKILAWDKDGLAIWSKRLERGTFEKLTRTHEGNLEIDSAELVMMLRGVQIVGAVAGNAIRSTRHRPLEQVQEQLGKTSTQGLGKPCVFRARR